MYFLSACSQWKMSFPCGMWGQGCEEKRQGLKKEKEKTWKRRKANLPGKQISTAWLGEPPAEIWESELEVKMLTFSSNSQWSWYLWCNSANNSLKLPQAGIMLSPSRSVVVFYRLYQTVSTWYTYDNIRIHGYKQFSKGCIYSNTICQMATFSPSHEVNCK